MFEKSFAEDENLKKYLKTKKVALYFGFYDAIEDAFKVKSIDGEKEKSLERDKMVVLIIEVIPKNVPKQYAKPYFY